MSTSRWVEVGRARALRRGRTRSFSVQGVGFLISNVEGSLFAVADVCTHDGGRLGPGRLRGAIVECPRHGACFDVRDGSVQSPPAVRSLASYPVRVVGGRVQVQLPVPEREDDARDAGR